MLMKIIPIFIVVLSIGSLAQTVEPDPEQAEFIENLNELRRNASKLYGISNMHELTYNRELAQIAGSPNYSSSGYLFATDGTYSDVLDNMLGYVEILKSFSDEGRERKMKESAYAYVWRFVNPPQTKIGCVKNSKRIVCVFGEDKKLSGWKKSDETPGSKCMKGYSNSDGLCVWEKKKFIDDLNEVRRSFAKKNNVNNMHKLVFNQSLVDTAKNLVWKDKDKDFDGARKTWRFTFFKSYQNASQESKEQMDWFNSKNKTSDFYQERMNFFLPPYEHLVPLQKFVGCAVRKAVVCLFGPAATFSMSDFENTKAGCQDNYILTDGLCTRSVPVATTPAANSGSQVTVVNVDLSKDQNHPVTYIPQTTTESELDRRIAEYKANEQDGDLPSKDDLEEITVSNSEDVSLLISVSFLLAFMLTE
ncbi:hypothetical protein CAEBREN_01413 [Caenorhabditis brenneri]|uniref:Uncharacterized protein n=1 Tax=Caenorhabditis brenneri TaxID=135651 RepID=G0MDD0_CAEBE|nr:hypothetical protein CAEBREN_01413 [Caenorhabditis brenneri]